MEDILQACFEVSHFQYIIYHIFCTLIVYVWHNSLTNKKLFGIPARKVMKTMVIGACGLCGYCSGEVDLLLNVFLSMEIYSVRGIIFF